MRVIAVTLFVVALIWASPSESKEVKAVPYKDIGGRIVNGNEAAPGQFPWQIGILGQNQAGGYFCGGSIIAPEWVLTAGHCIDGARSADIYLGTTRVNDPNRVVAKALAFFLPKGYISETLTNDIGLIQLTLPVNFNDVIQPVALGIRDPTTGSDVVVSGWGLTKDSDVYVSNILYYTTVLTIENIDCEKIYGTVVVDNATICANPGDPHTSPCQGDSGAPVVVLDSCGKPVQVAVFSFTNGYGCEYALPSGNTRVSFFRDWIKEKTGI